LELDKERLAKLMSMTGSGHDAEALAAVRKANALLRAHGKSWADVIGATAEAAKDPAQRTANESQSGPAGPRETASPPNYQRTRPYRNAFRREPVLSRLLGFPFWLFVEVLAIVSPNARVNTRGPIITIVFAVSMLLGVASWAVLGYVLLSLIA